MELPIVRGGEACQGIVLPVGSRKGAAVYSAVDPGKFYRLQIRLCKDMYIVRPGVDGVGRLVVIKVVVPGGDEHRDLHFPQRPGQRPDGFRVYPGSVEQVAGEEDQVHPLLLRQRRQSGGEFPQFPAALGALFRRQARQGGIQMEVGGVE